MQSLDPRRVGLRFAEVAAVGRGIRRRHGHRQGHHVLDFRNGVRTGVERLIHY